MVKNKISLKQLFKSLQEEMNGKLKLNKKCTKHSTSKGDLTENDWIEFIRSYLPKRYSIDKGFVIDKSGNISEQIDIIIYDNIYCPFIFNKDSLKYIPAESVFSIFEVKQTLNKHTIEYAIKKANSVRSLSRTSKPIVGIERELKAKTLKPIICGLLTTNVGWKNKITERISNLLNKNGKNALNLICSLDSGFYSYKDNKVRSSKKTAVLINFIFSLFDMLQKIGNPPAINLNDYASLL